MTRDKAIALARTCALVTQERHGYLPSTAAESSEFTPHAWVVDAIVLAGTGTEALKAALLDANQQCRSAFQVANRIATELGTHALQTNFGAQAECLHASLGRQHKVILCNGGYPNPLDGDQPRPTEKDLK